MIDFSSWRLYTNHSVCMHHVLRTSSREQGTSAGLPVDTREQYCEFHGETIQNTKEVPVDAEGWIGELGSNLSKTRALDMSMIILNLSTANAPPSSNIRTFTVSR